MIIPIKSIKNKLENFKKLGLEFNDVVKKINTATPKIKQNREIKLEKKVEILKNKVDKFIEDKKRKNNILNHMILKHPVL